MTPRNDEYFAGLNARLKSEGIARPVILLDLDRVDDNLDLVSGCLGDRLRIVTKSLPSFALLEYIMKRTGTTRLMAFHLPFVKDLLLAFPDCRILMGKPFLKPAMVEFFNSLTDPGLIQQAADIEWLVDTRENLMELVSLAAELQLRLKVSLELDVGLHRGGISTSDEAHQIAAVFHHHKEAIEWSGVMGYEAHVPYYPDTDAEFQRSMNRYKKCVDDLVLLMPDTQVSRLTLNSGGSSTYFRFNEQYPVNDIATGSAVIKPAAFNILERHKRALFIAAPVIRKFPTVSRATINENQALSIYLYGGGWAAEIAYPSNMMISPQADPPNQNLLPNQSLYLTNESTSLDRGDFVFFWPQQSDAMFQFEDILVVRGGKVIDRWKCFPRRY